MSPHSIKGFTIQICPQLLHGLDEWEQTKSIFFTDEGVQETTSIAMPGEKIVFSY